MHLIGIIVDLFSSAVKAIRLFVKWLSKDSSINSIIIPSPRFLLNIVLKLISGLNMIKRTQQA